MTLHCCIGSDYFFRSGQSEWLNFITWHNRPNQRSGSPYNQPFSREATAHVLVKNNLKMRSAEKKMLRFKRSGLKLAACTMKTESENRALSHESNNLSIMRRYDLIIGCLLVTIHKVSANIQPESGNLPDPNPPIYNLSLATCQILILQYTTWVWQPARS
jgi:hypothetical protein